LLQLREFGDLGRSVIPIFLSIDHFLYRFPTFGQKKKERKSPQKNKHGVDTVIIIFAQCPRHLCYFSSKIKKVH